MRRRLDADAAQDVLLLELAVAILQPVVQPPVTTVSTPGPTVQP